MEPRSTVSSSERRRAFSSSSTRSCSLLASSVGALASAGEGRVTSSLGEVVVAVVPVAVTAAVSTTVSGSKTSLGGVWDGTWPRWHERRCICLRRGRCRRVHQAIRRSSGRSPRSRPVGLGVGREKKLKHEGDVKGVDQRTRRKVV